MAKQLISARLALFLFILLEACSGKEGDTSPANTSPSAFIEAPTSILVGTTVLLDGSGSSDYEGSPLVYSWALTAVPAGSSARMSSANAVKPSFFADKEGTYVATLTVSDGELLSTAFIKTITALPKEAPPNTFPTAIIDAPTSRLVGASVSLNGNRSSDPENATLAYNWLLTSKPAGSAATLAGEATSQASFNADSAGSYTISLIVNDGELSSAPATATVEILPTDNLTILVDKPEPLSGIAQLSLSGPTPGASLRWQVDGSQIGTGESITWDTESETNASHEVTALVKLSRAAPVKISHRLQVFNQSNTPSKLQVSTPIDGVFAYSTLHFSGDLLTSKAATTISAKFDNKLIFQTTDRNFDSSYNLTGIPPGSYYFTVEAMDDKGVSLGAERRTVVVTSQSSLAYTPSFSIGRDGTILAADEDWVVYASEEDPTPRLRDTENNTDIILQRGIETKSIRDWSIDRRKIYAIGTDTDCEFYSCLYQWQSTGERINLSNRNPWKNEGSPSTPVTKDGFAIWSNGGVSFSIYDLASDNFTRITPPVGIKAGGNASCDLAVVNGIIHYFYWGYSGSTYKMYEWKSDTQESTQIQNFESEKAICPKTDGARVVWLQSTDASSTRTLFSKPMLGDEITVISTLVLRSFTLKDGVLTWIDSVPLHSSERELKASTDTETQILSRYYEGESIGTSKGFLVYDSERKILNWNSASGASVALIEAPVVGQKLTGGDMFYFTVGETRTVYKVPFTQ